MSYRDLSLIHSENLLAVLKVFQMNLPRLSLPKYGISISVIPGIFCPICIIILNDVEAIICLHLNSQLMSLTSYIHLSSGRFLCDIHLDRWTIWFFFGNSPTWLTYLEYFNVLYSWPSKREESLSLFIALL